MSGYDLYIVDLDLDDDGVLDHYDTESGEGPSEFVLVNRPWHQQYPDIWWPFVVWSDRRNSNQEDIYAYDLSLDSDGDSVPNWKDLDRYCIDPAEFPVTLDPAPQTSPEIYSDTVVWEDLRNGNQDIYGAVLQPVQPQPRVHITGTAQEQAIYWLDQHTVNFAQVQDIPGYIAATGMITRYKSFTQGGIECVRRAWYSSSAGSYVVGYDYCYYGTPDQKRYLGRFGRGFIYDQGLALIARTMLSQPTQAEALGHFVSGLQNSGQLSTTSPGSFGFSFNGQGYWGEKDNFYDMDYLRIGANAWTGYGLLFYANFYTGTQFMETITRVADYILDHQVITPTDPRYGLFTGGSGSWITNTSEFTDTAMGWCATEHNIDTYFFLRDLGEMTGDNPYIDAATLLRANMPKLWDETKGRLSQGMGPTGTLDTNDALDAASWGAIYWTAVGDLNKAIRSLEYADYAYSNTVTITWVSPTLSIWGYKPYSDTADVVWSEGSLGVAMADLKLGHALLDRGDPSGNDYIQRAYDILAEMEKLQTVDPDGGLLYAASSISETGDFPAAPSAAGATWFLMVQQAIADSTMRDAFWGSDQGLIYRTAITGPTAGWIDIPHTFTATVSPVTATQPITYVWQATGQKTTTTTVNTISFTWVTPGRKGITVTAANSLNAVSGIHTVNVNTLGITKTVTPQGQVRYGDELTYTLVVSAPRGTQVTLSDPLDGMTFTRFVTQPTGISHDDGVIAGPLTVTPTERITVSFVVQAGIPGTAGRTVTVTNRACVIPPGGTLGNCVWSENVSTLVFRPYGIYLPVVMRNDQTANL